MLLCNDGLIPPFGIIDIGESPPEVLVPLVNSLPFVPHASDIKYKIIVTPGIIDFDPIASSIDI